MNILYVTRIPNVNIGELRSAVLQYFTGEDHAFNAKEQLELPSKAEQLQRYHVVIAREYVVWRNGRISASEQANGTDTVPFLMMLEDIRFVVVDARSEYDFVEIVGAFSAYPDIFRNACLAYFRSDGRLRVASPIGGASTLMLQEIRLKTGMMVTRPEPPKQKTFSGEPFLEIVYCTVAGGSREECLNTSELLFSEVRIGENMEKLTLPALTRSLKTISSDPDVPLAAVRNSLRLAMSYGFSGPLGRPVAVDTETCASSNPLNAWIVLRRLKDGGNLVTPEDAEHMTKLYCVSSA